MGDCMGWHCVGSEIVPAEIWLEQQTVFKVVYGFAQRQGDTFLLSAPSLWRRLAEKGLLLKNESNTETGRSKTTVKRIVAGISKRVMILSAELIESG